MAKSICVGKGVYYWLIDKGYKSLLHYDYDKDNYWYRSNDQKNISISKLNTIIDIIKDILKS